MTSDVQMTPQAESLVALRNAVIYTGDEVVKGKALLIEKGKIVALSSDSEVPSHALSYDTGGVNIAPGLIDLQIYGAGGYLFSENTSALAIAEISRAIVATGTTSYALTLATNTVDKLLSAAHVAATGPHPALLGLHFEGPYINPDKRGAHSLIDIRIPDEKEIRLLVEQSKASLRIMTIAPEFFSDKAIGVLRENGVLLSAGHSSATMKQATEGFSRGIGTVTHLFNAMSPFHHREPGLPGAVFRHGTASASIIADGIHVDYEVVRVSKQIMGERLFLISDAVTHTSSGTYQHILQEGRYVLPDGTLSGSALSLLRAVANCVQHVGIPLDEALRMASRYPARLIGETDIGDIKPGSWANLILFDRHFELKRVMLRGEWQS